jgi:hypothetical protein
MAHITSLVQIEQREIHTYSYYQKLSFLLLLLYLNFHLFIAKLIISNSRFTLQHWRTQGGGLGGSTPPEIPKF